MKGIILILDCSSTSANYIYDIREEGYTPVLMEFIPPKSETDRNRKLHDFYYSLNGDTTPEIIFGGQDYYETLRIVKDLRPSLILAGSDRAIEWASLLSNDLNLPGASPRHLLYMRNKYFMQQVLKNAGIRYIKSALATSYREALDFYLSHDKKPIVIKPLRGTATIGVCICSNENEIKDAVDYNKSLKGIGHVDETRTFLLQEYIEGIEFVVNTISSARRHIVTSAMKYDKIQIEGRGKIYNYVQSVSPTSVELKPIVDYIIKVLDAIPVTIGPTHSEIMVDNYGPVLIEVNCRPCGGLMRRSWLEKFLGHHETDIYLKAYLHPENFNLLPSVFEPISNGLIKPIIVPHDIYAKHNNLYHICSKLESFDYEFDMGGERLYGKTIDFSTNGGFVYLRHNDKNVIIKDCLFLHQLEMNTPELIFENDSY